MGYALSGQTCVVARAARTLERAFQETVECELKRTVFFFTHRVSPSVVGFLASEPGKIRARRMIQWVRYHGEIGNPGQESIKRELKGLVLFLASWIEVSASWSCS